MIAAPGLPRTEIDLVKGPLEVTTYRLEQWSRSGQILRAEYVDEFGEPYTLRRVLDDAAACRTVGQNEIRIATAEGEPVDEVAALDATMPARVAHRWLGSRAEIYLTSGDHIAACLRLVADRLERIGEIHETSMQITFHPSHALPEEARRSAADAIAAEVGTYAQPTEMSSGSWQYTTNHRVDSIDAVQAYVGIKAPEPEPVDEPKPELVDGDRDDPETGDPVPDGVEGHPVGRVVEQTARAILQPDTLPGEPVDEEKRCSGCNQPWALIISGNAGHEYGCNQIGPEAGETEDALGVPGLTAGEADDFMSGGAR